MNLALLLAAAEGDHPAWYLDPHGFGLVFWTGIVFGLVALLRSTVAGGPLLQALDDREDAIGGSIASAEALKREAAELKAQYEEQLEKVRQEAQAIINEGEADKRRIIQEAHVKASQEADEIRARADRDIGLAKTKALAEVKQDAVILAMAIAEKVISAEVDAKKHKAIVDDVVSSYAKG